MNTVIQTCPLPPASSVIKQSGWKVYLKEFLLFFFRFGLCPACITASVTYGLYRIYKRIKFRQKIVKISLLMPGILLCTMPEATLAQTDSSQTQKSKSMKLQVNQQTPGFTTTDVWNSPVSLQSLKGTRLYLAFMRNAGCPVCNLRTHELLQHAADFERRNIKMLLVYESSGSQMKEYLAQENYPFTFIADPENRLYLLYGIERSMGKIFKGMFNGLMGKASRGKKLHKTKMKQDGHATTIPSEFLIDETGKLVITHYGSYAGDHIPLADIR